MDPSKPVRCRNGECVFDALDCPYSIPLYEEILINFDQTVDVGKNETIEISTIRTTFNEKIDMAVLNI